eukprot:5427976-Amphidinium_carterae.2
MLQIALRDLSAESFDGFVKAPTTRELASKKNRLSGNQQASARTAWTLLQMLNVARKGQLLGGQQQSRTGR